MKRVLSKCWSSSKRAICHMFKSVNPPERVTVWGDGAAVARLTAALIAEQKCLSVWSDEDVQTAGETGDQGLGLLQRTR